MLKTATRLLVILLFPTIALAQDLDLGELDDSGDLEIEITGQVVPERAVHHGRTVGSAL